jgi:hypothetical protein
MNVLSAINFEISVDLPYKYIAQYKNNLKGWTEHDISKFLGIASNFANDSFLSEVCVLKTAPEIALTCLFLAGRFLGKSLEVPAVDQDTLAMLSKLYTTLVPFL